MTRCALETHKGILMNGSIEGEILSRKIFEKTIELLPIKHSEYV